MRGVVQGVQPDVILGVRSAGNYSEVWLANGSMVLDSRSLGVWSTLLPQRTFFRIHRTLVINALHVVEVDRRVDSSCQASCCSGFRYGFE
ncbi:LytTR family DNA-binding domain-containing protein [Mesopusillimonas faecipullorum]|uniref:LytTR family DNA-binding domain-containing protein n=1 Tax=Mesopusillimonas faecipullorum TaxID=2755040 RepID=UPI001D011BCE|nr:LytTR family DNA-binding domain-containing protein [Mesopusillimonas faecipullorum]